MRPRPFQAMQRLKKAYRRPSLSPRHADPSVLAVALDHGDLAALAGSGGSAPSRVGVLLKYTNVVKGWKRRLFSLQNGVLVYGSAGDDDERLVAAAAAVAPTLSNAATPSSSALPPRPPRPQQRPDRVDRADAVNPMFNAASHTPHAPLDPAYSNRHASGKKSRTRMRAKRRLLRRHASKEEKERDIKGRINLQFAAITADDSDPHRFAIDVGYDVYHCKAETTADRDSWVAILNESNAYFKGLITSAAARARERPPADESKQPQEHLREKSEESDDSVIEDDGLREAEESRKALMGELHHVVDIWRGKWLDDSGSVSVPSEADFVKSLMETFSTQPVKTRSKRPTGSAIRDTAKSLLDLTAWSLQVLTTNDEMYDRRLKADLARMMGRAVPVFPPGSAGNDDTYGRVYREGEFSDGESECDLEFYDALSRSASLSSHSRLHMGSSESRTVSHEPSADTTESNTAKDIPALDVSTDAVKHPNASKEALVDTTEAQQTADPAALRRVETGLLGPETSPTVARTRLPTIGPREKLNIWSIVKDSIGKDLSKISIPVVLNEPLSFVQRLAEDVEYSELFDKAAETPDPYERLMYVAAGVVSHYSSTLGRVNKPFNPLLGETFELVLPSKGKGMRFVSEQVSHHPPISAGYAEGAGNSWKYYNAMELKNKFWGKSLEIFPTGLNHIEIPEYGDHYVFEHVTTCVHNIVVGRMWLDNYGEIVIENRNSGDNCVLTFNKTGWMSDSRSFASIKGVIQDKDKNEKIRLGGNWNERVYRDFGKGKHETLWTVSERPPASASNGYNWTKWAISLNQPVPDEFRKHVAPTDSRFRPDQRSLEDGNNPIASEFKTLLEQGQRDRRKSREDAGEEWQALWFDKAYDEKTGKNYYKFNGDYFRCKAACDWQRCPDLFSCASPDQLAKLSSDTYRA